MIESLVKANLNLYAVLGNLPQLVANDPAARQATAAWQIAIQFTVWRGPAAWMAFEDGVCSFGRGRRQSADLVLLFFGPKHFNRMMDGKANPVPLKGFNRLGFMSREFPKVAGRLAYFLKSDPTKRAEPDYLALSTRLILARTVFAVRELALLDPVVRPAASRIRDGAVQLKILPDGPAAHLIFDVGEVTPGAGEIEHPMARVDFGDLKIANAFLNGRLDPFTAIAGGDVQIRGQTSMLDNLSLIFDRIPHYLG